LEAFSYPEAGAYLPRTYRQTPELSAGNSGSISAATALTPQPSGDGEFFGGVLILDSDNFYACINEVYDHLDHI
jgi:hypothetical protein